MKPWLKRWIVRLEGFDGKRAAFYISFLTALAGDIALGPLAACALLAAGGTAE